MVEVHLEDKVYEIEDTAFDAGIELMYYRENQRYCLLALYKLNKGYILLENYDNADELMAKVHEYRKLGYKVYYKNNSYFVA